MEFVSDKFDLLSKFRLVVYEGRKVEHESEWLRQRREALVPGRGMITDMALLGMGVEGP